LKYLFLENRVLYVARERFGFAVHLNNKKNGKDIPIYHVNQVKRDSRVSYSWWRLGDVLDSPGNSFP